MQVVLKPESMIDVSRRAVPDVPQLKARLAPYSPEKNELLAGAPARRQRQGTTTRVSSSR
jgi:hypothetical protein